MPRAPLPAALPFVLAAGPGYAAEDVLTTAVALLNREFAVPGWALALLALAALPLLVLLVRGLVGRLAPWRRYRQDRFLGMVWRWRFRRGQPSHICCYCPDDDTQLVYNYSQHDHQVVFHCETCGRDFGGFSGDQDYVRGMIRRQVARKLRTGEWREAGRSASTADA